MKGFCYICEETLEKQYCCDNEECNCGGLPMYEIICSSEECKTKLAAISAARSKEYVRVLENAHGEKEKFFIWTKYMSMHGVDKHEKREPILGDLINLQTKELKNYEELLTEGYSCTGVIELFAPF